MRTREFLFKEIGTKKGLVVLLVLFLLASFFIVQRTKKIDSRKMLTGFVGVKENATLSLSPDNNTYNVGDEFIVNVLLNTAGKNVVAVGVYLNYDPSQLQVINIDTTNSIFGKSYEIINYNGSASHTPAGKIEIVKSAPRPGVNTSNGLIAKINFRALSETTPSEDNVRFEFTSAYARDDSDVILDDGQGTDILSGVNNAKYTILSSTTPRGSIKITLEGKTNFSALCSISILNPTTGGVIYSIEKTSDTNGNLKIGVATTTLPAGTYDFKITVPYYLSKKITGVNWPPSGLLEFPEVLAGNLNDQDNQINSLDWSIMSKDWGKNNVPSDINADGIVNAIDWSFLNKNWGKTGD